ncbi:MAG: hypothetical protein IJH34_03320 [Romboutsia sp.]|nr:hypothetical protein [Romboutsia sp.]
MRRKKKMSINDMLILLFAIVLLGCGCNEINNNNNDNDQPVIGDNLQEIIDSSEDYISIPGEKFEIKTGLALKSGVYQGQKDKTIIFVTDSFNAGKNKPNDEFAVFNKNFNLNFNNNADDITIKDVTFILENKSNKSTILTLLGFANIKQLTLERCKVIVKNDYKLEQCGFDIYAACKNVTLKNCEFEISTFGETGGNWIRNYSTDYTGNSVSENIIIDSCVFKTNSKDEALAVYGWNNVMKNVLVKNCRFIQTDNAAKANMLISIFGSDRSPYDNKNGEISDVILDSNYYEVNNTDAFVLQIGNDSEIGTVDKISVLNSEIYVNCNLVAPVRGYSYCTNTSVERCKFYLSNNAEVNTGIYSIKNAVSNEFIGGKIDSCFDDVENVIDNLCKNVNVETFARDCLNVKNNDVLCSTLCTLYYLRNSVNIIQNNFIMGSINKNAIMAINNNSSKNKKADITIDGNTIDMKSTKNKLAWTSDQNVKFYISNNIITNAKNGVIVDPSSALVLDSKNSKNGKVKSLNS